MPSRWERIAPLTGLLAVAIILVAFIALGGSTPDVKSSGEKVLRFYHAHRNRQMGASFVLFIGAAVLIFFAGTLRSVLARPPASGRLASIAFGGGVAGASGFLFAATTHLALADSGKYGDVTVTRTLNFLDANDYLAFAGGVGVMALAAGISMVRTRVAPIWLGIVGIIAGVLTFTPLGFFGFILCGLWIIVTSVVLAMRPPAAAT